MPFNYWSSAGCSHIRIGDLPYAPQRILRGVYPAIPHIRLSHCWYCESVSVQIYIRCRVDDRNWSPRSFCSHHFVGSSLHPEWVFIIPINSICITNTNITTLPAILSPRTEGMKRWQRYVWFAQKRLMKTVSEGSKSLPPRIQTPTPKRQDGLRSSVP